MSEPPGESGAAPAPDGARGPWWRLLMPAAPDVVALLVVQGELTVAGMDAFDAWSHPGAQDMADAVRAAQHHAYHARRELLAALQAALSTPIDQEDLYTLSERIDRILTEARATLREAEVLGRASYARIPKKRAGRPTRPAVSCTTWNATTARRWRSWSRPTTRGPSSPDRSSTATISA